MITRIDIDERVREWGLREDVVEKDYVLGWLLWGIGSDPDLSEQWAFKGGTCLKKCYFDTYQAFFIPEGSYFAAQTPRILKVRNNIIN